MKKLLLIAFALFPSLLFAKNYTEVVEVPGKTADQLYSSAREWFAETFNSANHVLQMDDPKLGKLIGKGSTIIKESATAGLARTKAFVWYTIDFTVKIYLKDGKYKVTIDDIEAKTKQTYLALPNIDISYLDLCKNREYYKKGSDPRWLRDSMPQMKSHYRVTADVNDLLYKLLIGIENEMPKIMSSLKSAMDKKQDDW
jgi:hypothetical protein